MCDSVIMSQLIFICASKSYHTTQLTLRELVAPLPDSIYSEATSFCFLCCKVSQLCLDWNHPWQTDWRLFEIIDLNVYEVQIFIRSLYCCYFPITANHSVSLLSHSRYWYLHLFFYTTARATSAGAEVHIWCSHIRFFVRLCVVYHKQSADKSLFMCTQYMN